MIKATNFIKTGIPWTPYAPIGWDIKRGKFVFKSIKEINSQMQCKDRLALTLKGVIDRYEGDNIGLNPSDLRTYQIFKPNELVFKLLDLDNKKTSRVGYVHKQGIMSSAYIRVLNNPEMNMRYFYYQYYDLYQRYIFNFIGQGVRATMSASDLLNIPILIPPLETQNAIVAYLDRKTQQIQEFIAKKERLIELLEEQLNKIIFSLIIESADCKQTKKNTNSAFQSLVPENWHEHRIKFLCSKPVTGQWGEDSKGNKNDIVCIRIADFNKLELITEGHTIRNIIPNDRLLLRENDLLIEKSGGGDKTPVGRVVKFSLPIKAITSNFISKISAKENIILSDYLLQIFYCLNIVRYNILSIKQTTGIQNLDMNHYLSNKIYIPSIENQKIILEKIKNLTRSNDNLIQKAYSEIEKAKEYQESLITQIVTGQLKVPEKANANLGQNLELGKVAEANGIYHSKH